MSIIGSTKPVYLRGIPAHVIREAKSIAARRGITLAVFVTDAIVRAIRQAHEHADEQVNGAASAGGADDIDDLSSDMRWYEQHRARLSRELAGQYAAIIDHSVVDHDADFDALARRVFTRHGLRNVFMPQVAAQARPVRVRSPRIEGARLSSPRATRAR
ncbi:MAG: hypothetical protein ABW321_23000 [Polyangiales bacterium]